MNLYLKLCICCFSLFSVYTKKKPNYITYSSIHPWYNYKIYKSELTTDCCLKIINVLPCIPKKLIIKYVSINPPHANWYKISKINKSSAKIKDNHHTSHVGTPSPRKKRNNSTPTRKNNAEKKQILQQLISPNTNKVSRVRHSDG